MPSAICSNSRMPTIAPNARMARRGARAATATAPTARNASSAPMRCASWIALRAARVEHAAFVVRRRCRARARSLRGNRSAATRSRGTSENRCRRRARRSSNWSSRRARSAAPARRCRSRSGGAAVAVSALPAGAARLRRSAVYASNANSSMPPSRCAMTTAGSNFSVTVHMPSNAWNTITTAAASGAAARPRRSRRRHQAQPASANVSRLRPPTRMRCTCSRQALSDSTGRSGNAAFAAGDLVRLRRPGQLAVAGRPVRARQTGIRQAHERAEHDHDQRANAAAAQARRRNARLSRNAKNSRGFHQMHHFLTISSRSARPTS